jgi:hypothetical protein
MSLHSVGEAIPSTGTMPYWRQELEYSSTFLNTKMLILLPLTGGKMIGRFKYY